MRFPLIMFCLVVLSTPLLAKAAEPFPFGIELMLDDRPQPGSKRMPMIQIEDDGSASIDLWCGSIRAQATVGDDGSLAITPGERDNGQCSPDRIAGDDDLLDMIVHMT